MELKARRVERIGYEVEYSSDLIPRNGVLFDDFIDSHTVLKILKTSFTGVRELRNTQAPLTFPGMLSTAVHFNQSRASIVIFLHNATTQRFYATPCTAHTLGWR
jgi:hypothetical protein